MEVKFLKIDIELMARYGVDVAVFYAYLKFVGRKIRKDKNGYFCFDANFFTRGLGCSRNKLHYIRKDAINAGLIDCISGQNQNIKPRYKIV